MSVSKMLVEGWSPQEELHKANLVHHLLCYIVVLKVKPRPNQELEIRSDKKTIHVMYHFNIRSQLATV